MRARTWNRDGHGFAGAVPAPQPARVIETGCGALTRWPSSPRLVPSRVGKPTQPAESNAATAIGKRTRLTRYVLLALTLSAASAATTLAASESGTPLGRGALVPVPLSGHASQPPEVSFESEAVVATGLLAGARVVWLALANEVRDAVGRYVYRGEISEATSWGESRLELGRAPARHSVWVAADLDSGSFTIAAPPGGPPLRRVPFPPGSIHPGQPNDPDFLLDARRHLILALIRPGPNGGAYVLSTGDGSLGDADGETDGRITILVENLRPMEGSPPLSPRRFLPHDRIIGIDSKNLEIYGARVGDVMSSE
jgi:hypothetical protein